MALGVANRGELGKAVFEVPCVTFAPAGVVDRYTAALQTRGVNRRLSMRGPDQAALAGDGDGGVKERGRSVFFSSRLSA